MDKNSSYYELIYDFVLNTSPGMSLEELSEKFIEIAGKRLPLKLIGVFVYDPILHQLVRLRAGYIDQKTKQIIFLNTALNLPEGKGIVWKVFKSKKSTLIKNSSRQPEFFITREELRYAGENAFIVPLWVEKEVKGALYIEKDGDFSESEVTFLEAVARILEKSFENTELVADIKREREEKTNILNSISYPIFIVDRDYHIKEYNKFFLDEFGVSPEEVERLKCYELVEKRGEVPYNCPLKNLIEGKKNATAKIKVEGKVYEASIFKHKSVYGNNLFVHTMKDITELDKKERNLNLLYRAGLSLATSVSIDEFKMKVEQFLEQESDVYVKVFWRDGVENHFDYKRPHIKRVGRIGKIIENAKGNFSFAIDYLGEEVGVVIISSKDGGVIPIEKVKFYKTFVSSVELAMQNLYLMEELKNALSSLNKNYKATLESLSHALDYREHETEYHSRRVASYAVLIGRKMDLTESELRNLYWGGLLHDIGKIGIPDAVLLKPGKLNEEEWAIMRRHPVIGFDILKHIEFLREALKVVLYHHERWDGKGYPKGLGDSEIPLLARIFAIADTYDAITSDRPYRKALPQSVAYVEIEKNRGLQFDPDIADLFLKKVDKKELLNLRKRVESDIQYSPID